MAIIKKGKIAASMIVSSMAYICDFCGYTKVVKNGNLKNLQCKKCIQGKMVLASGEAGMVEKEEKEKGKKK